MNEPLPPLSGTETARIERACATAGVRTGQLVLLGRGDSTTVAVNDDVVAKLTRFAGQRDAAHRDVVVSQWLAAAGIPAVRAAGDAVDVDVDVDEHLVVTLWERIPDHRSGTPAEVAAFLRRLHAVPVGTAPGELAGVDPFVRVADRVDAAGVSADDQRFLHARLGELRARWPPAATVAGVVLHGDPNTGNIVATRDGHVLALDLERVAIGPPEWDLTLQAVSYGTCRWITRQQYDDFVTTYGTDVTLSPAYGVFRDVRELRMTAWLAHKAGHDQAARAEAGYRVACLRGRHGPRPWRWSSS